jgi:hypothetical protein
MVISIVCELEGRFLTFAELADSTISSFDRSQRVLDPDGQRELPSFFLGTLKKSELTLGGAFFDRLAMQPQAPKNTNQTDNNQLQEIPFYWAKQCAIAKAFYSFGHKEQAWAMLVEAVQVAGSWRVATLASVGLKRDGYMKVDEFKKLFAKTGGNKRAEKIQLVELFSIDLFAAGNWKSTKQAGAAIWPKVKARATLLGWDMSDETGPETVYKWLLAHKKIRGLQVNA